MVLKKYPQKEIVPVDTSLAHVKNCKSCATKFNKKKENEPLNLQLKYKTRKKGPVFKQGNGFSFIISSCLRKVFFSSES